MKSVVLASLALWSKANNVPIPQRTAGWNLGTHGAEVQLRVFVDLLCPDSSKTHTDLEILMALKSPVPGKDYN